VAGGPGRGGAGAPAPLTPPADATSDEARARRLTVVVYSDFLCPWCWNAATRLAAVETALAGALALDWRSYLLRRHPRPRTPEALADFRAYTEGWRRVAEDEPRAPFRTWSGEAGPPTHSLPAHLVAKAAASLGEEPGRRMRERLFRAYFAESRDISDAAVLRALWRELALDESGYARAEDPETERRVLAEHDEAQALGASGVPAVRLAGQEFVLVGAQPEAVYLRWFRRALESA
jgi:predicted DsbA family dithiol-disulfide isomerase